MKKIELKEMQNIELNLLLELDRVCKENHLRYYMDGGTLLGAMCYEGFIPWDDDIDLKMPRKDYEKLLSLQKEFPKYIFLDAPRKEHCEYMMLKLIDNRTVLLEHDGEQVKKTGVYIDIFPMDAYPVDSNECEKHLNQLQKLNSLFHSSLNNYKNYLQATSIITRLKGYTYRALYNPWKLYQKITKLAKKYDYESAKNVGLLVEGNPMKEKFEKKWLEPEFYLEFEGKQIPAPVGYKRHLEIFFGDHITQKEYYHNLPVILPDHQHEVYWKE